ncbi:hypothetical protein [Streptomyces sp. 021-4]|uniref:hypothetical protein n=1 Tax=Streptomyces sp. 021-4 TaxID=2789260 RepID=UPI0039F60474
MNQCTGMAVLAPPDYLAELAGPDDPAHPELVLCELGEDHDDDHARLLWDEDPHGAVWVRWNERRAVLSGVLPWCPEEQTGTGEACGLFADHPSAHAWDVVDPTMKAVADEYDRAHGHRFRGFGEADAG